MLGSATKIIYEGFQEWNAGPSSKGKQLAKFNGLAERNTILGLNRNLVIEEYADTPILNSLLQLPRTTGMISIAYVPSGLGKSTAAMRALSKYSFRGIAICNSNKGQEYVITMLQHLKLDVSNPPQGWISLLLEALKRPDGEERHPVLILDEFTCETKKDANAHFIATLKAHVKNTGIHIVVLTPDDKCANILSGSNSLVTIRPMHLVYSEPSSFPDGNWIDMSWTIDQLKVACKNNKALRREATKDAIEQKFDELVARDSEDSLKGAHLSDVMDRLLPLINEMPLIENSNTEVHTENDDDAGCAANCCLM